MSASGCKKGFYDIFAILSEVKQDLDPLSMDFGKPFESAENNHLLLPQ